jgi:L-ascorbate metabolism protein UlaG (beta-lactamase superfamily)
MDKKILRILIVIILILGAISLVNRFMTNPNNMNNNITNAQTDNGDIQVIPIYHATMVLKWGGKVIYVDPVGGAKGINSFAGQPAPDLILLTHDHSDHFDLATLAAVSKANTDIIVPMPMAYKFTDAVAGTLYVMKNGQKTTKQGFGIEAIPMYNIPESKNAYHIKGDGNGYVIEMGGRRVYISGDTSDTPEMNNLKNIDIAFVCMNLPYTMSVEEAARGVLAFKPKQVYPYHYRGTDGLSDINKFKELVNKGDPNIDVVLANWYPNK